MSIYHLHIPRTSGVFIREKIINVLVDSPKFIGHSQQIPESFSDFKYISGHFATNPVTQIDTTFAIVRNPVDLTFSYIQYLRDWFYPILTFGEVFDKLEREDKLKHFTNINIKFLTGYVDIKKYNSAINNIKNLPENGWYVENYLSNIKLAKDFIDNNKIEIINFNDPDRYKIISEIYGVNVKNEKINQSNEIDKRFIKEYGNAVEDLNKIDLELYNLIS